jgi:hypothetical protein
MRTGPWEDGPVRPHLHFSHALIFDWVGMQVMAQAIFLDNGAGQRRQREGRLGAHQSQAAQDLDQRYLICYCNTL